MNSKDLRTEVAVPIEPKLGFGSYLQQSLRKYFATQITQQL
jgi:hypothetical protein